MADSEQDAEYTVCTICSGDYKYSLEPPDEAISGDSENIECVSSCEYTHHGYSVKEVGGQEVKYCVKCSEKDLYYADASGED